MNSNGHKGKIRTLVCGSRFGQFYLEAVKALPEQFELVGLLAKGSERSRQCAARFGVPLYTDAAQLPGGIDLACVVLRSGVMGGGGSELALALLERGISVLQEHPVHHKDMAACMKKPGNATCITRSAIYTRICRQCAASQFAPGRC